MRKYGDDIARLMDRAQQRIQTDEQDLGRLSISAVSDLLPLLAGVGLTEGELTPEELSGLAIAFALGVSISREEIALGWQTVRGADPRAFNAVVAAGYGEGGTAARAYLVRVGYFVGRHGSEGMHEVIRSLGG